MTKERFTIRTAVYTVLIKDNKLHVQRRFNTGWQDGKYSLIAGHIEENETVTAATIREAREESGLALKPENLRVAHVMHRKSNDNIEYIDFFLMADKWEGEPSICEPEKCDEMKWVPLNNLPDKLLPYIKSAIENIQRGIYFSEFGW